MQSNTSVYHPSVIFLQELRERMRIYTTTSELYENLEEIRDDIIQRTFGIDHILKLYVGKGGEESTTTTSFANIRYQWLLREQSYASQFPKMIRKDIYFNVYCELYFAIYEVVDGILEMLMTKEV
jgi:hypothetical protein